MVVTIAASVVALLLGGLGLAALDRALPVAMALYVLGWGVAAFVPVWYVGRLLLEAGLTDLAFVVAGGTWAALLLVGVSYVGAPVFRRVQSPRDRHRQVDRAG